MSFTEWCRFKPSYPDNTLWYEEKIKMLRETISNLEVRNQEETKESNKFAMRCFHKQVEIGHLKVQAAVDKQLIQNLESNVEHLTACLNPHLSNNRKPMNSFEEQYGNICRYHHCMQCFHLTCTYGCSSPNVTRTKHR